MNNTNPLLTISGVFEASTTINGFPAYENVDAGLYLYYFVLSQCQTFWTIGPALGQALSIAHSSNSSLPIDQIDGPWNLLIGGIWVEDSNMDVICLS